MRRPVLDWPRPAVERKAQTEDWEGWWLFLKRGRLQQKQMPDISPRLVLLFREARVRAGLGGLSLSRQPLTHQSAMFHELQPQRQLEAAGGRMASVGYSF